MPEDDPRTAVVEEALQVFPRRLLAHLPDWLEDRSRPGVWAVSSDVASPFLNQVAWARPDEVDADALVADVVAEFTARGMPWSWSTTPSSTSRALEGALRRAGLEPSVETAMHAALPLDLPPGGTHRVVVDEAPTRDLLETMAAVFGMPGSLVDVVARVQAIPGVGPEISVRVLEDERVVGVAQGYPDSGTVLLGNIATPEDARGRGIGTAATAAVVRVAQERGLTDAVLVSSPAGHGIYRRLGFADVCPTTTWTWWPPDGGG